MSQKIIVHVSEVDIVTTGGMGRIAYYWKKAFEKAGYKFIHIGPAEVGKLPHKVFFGFKAWQYFKRLQVVPDLFIVHEASAGFFVKNGILCFLESHGVERRFWEQIITGKVPFSLYRRLPLKTKLLFPLWRLSVCDRGLKHADKLLLCNADDEAYVKRVYKRQSSDIFTFRNGIFPVNISGLSLTERPFTILFNASWIIKKGIDVLVNAARIVYIKGLIINYLLIGTGKDEQAVLNDWPSEIKPYVKVISHFDQTEEHDLLTSGSLFVLPSYNEGQPLSLLQAMAAGKCCITTNCCGQKDIVENCVTGLLFAPGDYESLAQLIIKCYQNPALVIQLGLNAKKQMEMYDWDEVSAEVVEFVTNQNSRGDLVDSSSAFHFC